MARSQAEKEASLRPAGPCRRYVGIATLVATDCRASHYLHAEGSQPSLRTLSATASAVQRGENRTESPSGELQNSEP